MSDVRAAIDAGDVAMLERSLAADRSELDELIHYVCDKVFDGTLTSAGAVPLVRALLAAGADIDHRSGDPLIKAGIAAWWLQLARAGAQLQPEWLELGVVTGDEEVMEALRG